MTFNRQQLKKISIRLGNFRSGSSNHRNKFNLLCCVCVCVYLYVAGHAC